MDQQLFLEQCRGKEEGKNYANELAELLGVNPDAAYRRIRGTTPLTYPEIQKICQYYQVSFDSAMNYQGSTHPFEFISMFDQNRFNMLTHVKETVAQLKFFKEAENCNMTLVAMDLPYFRQFGYPNLLRFKLFYWQRAILNIEAHQQMKFDPSYCNEAIEAETKQLHIMYHGIDSIELWTPESLDSTLKQIKYGLDSGFFASLEDAMQICDDLDDLITKLEREAVVSKKYIKTENGEESGKFELYQSDILLGTNTVQVQRNEELYTYIGFNSFNSLMSKSPSFSHECHRWIMQFRSKSTMLSDVSEKLRYQFFQSLRSKINAMRTYIPGVM